MKRIELFLLIMLSLMQPIIAQQSIAQSTMNQTVAGQVSQPDISAVGEKQPERAQTVAQLLNGTPAADADKKSQDDDQCALFKANKYQITAVIVAVCCAFGYVATRATY